MSDFLLDISSFDQGLQVLSDTTVAPIGSARTMENMIITDRGGIAPRPGTELYGTYNSSSAGCDGLFNYIKSGVETELKVKAYNGRIEYYHPDYGDWALLKSGYTAGYEFGFKEHLTNTENEDYLYGCNAKENYFRWSGSYTQVNGAYASGTTLTVDSTLKNTTYETGTATGTSATVITDTGKTWATDQWINFYVLITSGSLSGYVRKITDSTATTLTIDTLGSDPGGAGVTYQIRMLKFPTSGILTVGTTSVTYSAVPTSTTFTITDPGSALADDAPVTVQPTEYPGAPRGNRLENHHTRMIVGGVQSGMSRDASGNLQGSQSTATVYVSKIRNATDFGFSASRVAGEGDIITAPYGGGNITDIVNFEDSFAVFKKSYIELDKYATDSTADIVDSNPLKTGFGAQGRVIKGKDDVYFVTADNQITSISRVQQKDTVPQSTNIGLVIKRLIDNYDFSSVRGDEYKQRLFFSFKSDSTETYNNRTLVYNRQTKSFEGIWLFGAAGFIKSGGDFFYAQSNGANVWKMFTGVNDVRGTNNFGITANWLSNWMHITPGPRGGRARSNQFGTQGINALGYEGYIKDGTTITFSLYKDFSDQAELTFDFGNSTDDQAFISGGDLGSFLGDNPLGLDPIGAITDPDADGYRHFKFIIYFPDIYSNYFSLGINSSGLNQSYEITRIGLGTKEDALQDSATINDIN